MVSRLEGLAEADRSGLGWTTAATPFFGWGSAARIEATALAVRALQRSERSRGTLTASGLATLLRGKDRFGTWHSTQTTVNVLDALIGSISGNFDPSANGGAMRIIVNGRTVAEIPPAGKKLGLPKEIDVSGFLDRQVNRVEVAGDNGSAVSMAQVVATHYADWKTFAAEDRYFDFAVDFDRTKAGAGEEIGVRVRAAGKRRTGGMAVAEIGLPPGAEIDRQSLETARKATGFSRYEIRPDRLVIYFWNTREVDFSFRFRPRFAMKAVSAPSVVYDYYNEEARRELPPAGFEVVER
jgi:hypothetical protein